MKFPGIHRGWTSQAAFDKFGKTLMPILAEIGLDPGKPTVMPIHNIIKPAATTAPPAADKWNKPLFFSN